VLAEGPDRPPQRHQLLLKALEALLRVVRGGLAARPLGAILHRGPPLHVLTLARQWWDGRPHRKKPWARWFSWLRADTARDGTSTDSRTFLAPLARAPPPPVVK